MAVRNPDQDPYAALCLHVLFFFRIRLHGGRHEERFRNRIVMTGILFKNIRSSKQGDFIEFYFCVLYSTLFICRPSDSSVSEDAGIKPRTSALAVRRSNHSASSHPLMDIRSSLYVVSNDQCCGSGMFIPDTGSWFLPIPDPGSKNSNKREG